MNTANYDSFGDAFGSIYNNGIARAQKKHIFNFSGKCLYLPSSCFQLSYVVLV